MSRLLTCSQLALVRDHPAAVEPPHRLGVGLDRLGGLALGGQPQGERGDLGLEYPGVQLLGLPGTRSKKLCSIRVLNRHLGLRGKGGTRHRSGGRLFP